MTAYGFEFKLYRIPGYEKDTACQLMADAIFYPGPVDQFDCTLRPYSGHAAAWYQIIAYNIDEAIDQPGWLTLYTTLMVNGTPMGVRMPIRVYVAEATDIPTSATRYPHQYQEWKDGAYDTITDETWLLTTRRCG